MNSHKKYFKISQHRLLEVIYKLIRQHHVAFVNVLIQQLFVDALGLLHARCDAMT
jgi:hypothetical protein